MGTAARTTPFGATQLKLMRDMNLTCGGCAIDTQAVSRRFHGVWRGLTAKRAMASEGRMLDGEQGAQVLISKHVCNMQPAVVCHL